MCGLWGDWGDDARIGKSAMDIFVGNISYQATADDLRSLFEAFGAVTSTAVISDRETGRSRGFGFVVMPDGGAAEAAIAALDGSPWLGRPIKVNQANPRTPRRPAAP